MQIHLHQDIQGAIDLLELAEKRIKPNRKFQEVRCMLNIARGWTAIGNTEKAINFWQSSLGNGKQEWLSLLCDAITASTEYIGNG